MKKTILALTIPALFATSASAVTVYSDEGAQVDIYGRIQYEAGERGYNEDFGGDGEARLGVNVKYMLNNDVDLIGKLEWAVVTEGDEGSDGVDDGEGIAARYAWAGFRFMDTTELTFGRSQDPYALVVYHHDIFNIFGANATYGMGIDDKVDDQIRVSYANNGLDLRAAYAFADDNKVNGNEAKKDQWSVAAGYTLPMGLGFGAAYEQQNYGNFGNPLTGDEDFDAWIVGVNYTLDGFYGAVAYTQQKLEDNTNEVETKGVEVTGTYNVDAWTLLAQYSYEETDIKGLGDYDSVDAWTLGVQYDLTSKAKLYAEYEINDDDLNRDDRYGMGIQYNF